MKSKKGTIEISVDGMICRPSALEIHPYKLPTGTLASVRLQEVAARILIISVSQGKWMGVTQEALIQGAIDDLALRQRYLRSLKRPPWESWRFLFYSVFTLSIYFFWRLFVDRKVKIPFRGISVFTLIDMEGIEMIEEETRHLIRGGWIKKRIHKDVIYLCPTPQLVERVWNLHGEEIERQRQLRSRPLKPISSLFHS